MNEWRRCASDRDAVCWWLLRCFDCNPQRHPSAPEIVCPSSAWNCAVSVACTTIRPRFYWTGLSIRQSSYPVAGLIRSKPTRRADKGNQDNVEKGRKCRRWKGGREGNRRQGRPHRDWFGVKKVLCFRLPPVQKTSVPKFLFDPHKYWCRFLFAIEVLLKKNCLHLVCYVAVFLHFFIMATIQCVTFYELLCNIAHHQFSSVQFIWSHSTSYMIKYKHK